jgi:hypothetical protein
MSRWNPIKPRPRISTLFYTRWFKYDRDVFVCKQVTVCPGDIWTTLYYSCFRHPVIIAASVHRSNQGSVRIKNAQRMRRVIFSSVVCPALPYFSTLSHNWHDFNLKKCMKYKTRVFFIFFSTSFFWNILCSKNNSARHCHKCTYVFMISTRYSCKILMKLRFCGQIFENYSNIMKIHSLETEFHAERRMDRQTDRQTDILDGGSGRFS